MNVEPADSTIKQHRMMYIKKMTNQNTTTHMREQFTYLILSDAKGSHNERIQFPKAQKRLKEP